MWEKPAHVSNLKTEKNNTHRVGVKSNNNNEGGKRIFFYLKIMPGKASIRTRLMHMYPKFKEVLKSISTSDVAWCTILKDLPYHSRLKSVEEATNLSRIECTAQQ